MNYSYIPPKGWQFLELENLAVHQKGAIRIGPFGSALKKHEYTLTGVRVLGIEDVLPNRLVSEKLKFIPEKKYQELKQYTVSSGDLLVTNMGTVGRVCVVPDDLEKSIISSHLIKVTVNKELAFPHYLSWILNYCPLVVGQIRAKCHGAIMAGFNSSLLKQLRIPLPPLHEQKRIADILDKADELRRKRKEAISKLDTLTQSIFLDMFGDPEGNPRNYPVRQLIDIVSKARPISYGILMPGPNLDSGVKYVRVVDMKNDGIDLSGVRNTSQEIALQYRRSKLASEDVLLSIRGHVGRLAIIPPELEGANITQDTARLAIAYEDPIYIKEYLKTARVQNWMKRHVKGVAVQGINLGDVKKIPVICPPKVLQDEFANRAKQIFALQVDNRRSLSRLNDLFASLQHRAFRGEL